jgi:hypothetical protein
MIFKKMASNKTNLLWKNLPPSEAKMLSSAVAAADSFEPWLDNPSFARKKHILSVLVNLQCMCLSPVVSSLLIFVRLTPEELL